MRACLHDISALQHLDLFHRFCTVHPRTRHTDTQTTLLATRVGKERIYAYTACDAAQIHSCTDAIGDTYV